MSDFNSDKLTTEVVAQQLKTIAELGSVDIQWTDLQAVLKLRLEAIIEEYKEKSLCEDDQLGEPNVDKFNLDESRDEMLDLIASFNEPPFTIQRICELLHSPFIYYNRISTFFRGLEKNLRVISSNDWPKCPTPPPPPKTIATITEAVTTEVTTEVTNTDATTTSTTNHQECTKMDQSSPPSSSQFVVDKETKSDGNETLSENIVTSLGVT